MDTFNAAAGETKKAASFLQISSSQEDKSRSKAYAKLKSLHKITGGLRLAFLAAELESGGHFDKIIVMIDRMIADLRVEEQHDIKARDVCQDQENALKSQEDDLQYNIEKKEDAKKRLEANHEDVGKKIESVKADIEATQGTLEEILAARNDENTEFKQALKDDTDAVSLLQQAIESLTAYYTNNKLPLELA